MKRLAPHASRSLLPLWTTQQVVRESTSEAPDDDDTIDHLIQGACVTTTAPQQVVIPLLPYVNHGFAGHACFIGERDIVIAEKYDVLWISTNSME